MNAMSNREKTLVISSPNLGGLSKISDGRIEVIDAISTTGISSDDCLFCALTSSKIMRFLICSIGMEARNNLYSRTYGTSMTCFW